jgi:hypothetical protein
MQLTIQFTRKENVTAFTNHIYLAILAFHRTYRESEKNQELEHKIQRREESSIACLFLTKYFTAAQ